MNNILQQLATIPTATIAYGQEDRGVLDPEIAAMWRPIKMFGIAYTIQAPPADNKAVHLAIDEAPPGSVLVASNSGHRSNALVGDIIIRNCIQNGFKGFVTDGVIRDLSECRDLGLPIYATGLCIRGPSKLNNGVRGKPIVIGGLTVETGDYLIGDDDGIVIVKPKDAESVIEKALKKENAEEEIAGRISKGENTIDIFNLRD